MARDTAWRWPTRWRQATAHALQLLVARQFKATASASTAAMSLGTPPPPAARHGRTDTQSGAREAYDGCCQRLRFPSTSFNPPAMGAHADGGRTQRKEGPGGRKGRGTEIRMPPDSARLPFQLPHLPPALPLPLSLPPAAAALCALRLADGHQRDGCRWRLMISHGGPFRSPSPPLLLPLAPASPPPSAAHTTNAAAAAIASLAAAHALTQVAGGPAGRQLEELSGTASDL